MTRFPHVNPLSPEFKAAFRHLGASADFPWIKNGHSNATAHYLDAPDGRGLACIVCLRGHEGRNPVEVAGLLVHEAVHAWQAYADHIGESSPGTEQEDYAIQAISQELMAEFARRQ